MVFGMLHPMGHLAMVASSCEVVKVAEDYVQARWPQFDFADRRKSSVSEGNLWKLRFLLPDRSFGFELEIRIGRSTCEVVDAVMWQ